MSSKLRLSRINRITAISYCGYLLTLICDISKSSNFDICFQKKKFQVDLRKSIFWKMTFSREHGLKFYKPFFKPFSRFESWSFFNVKKIKKLKNNRKRFIKRYGTLYNRFLFQTVSHVQVTAPLGDGNGIVTAW